MNTIIITISLPVLGYLMGSLPFALWVTRLIKGIDVRDYGSGHVTTTNTIRQAGFGWGVLVFVLDVSKGFIPTYIAANFSDSHWIVALTATLSVVGHCWPIFAQFRGGMGLATTSGVMLAISPLSALISLGILLIFVLTIKHAARGSLFTAITTPIILWIIGFRGLIITTGVPIAIVLVFRFWRDWNRKYGELWLDREKS